MASGEIQRQYSMANQKLVYRFNATSSVEVTFDEPLDDFNAIFIRLHNSDGVIVGSAFVPIAFAKGNSFKIFGESSAQWGSIVFSSDGTKATMNRTSSNTLNITINGLY